MPELGNRPLLRAVTGRTVTTELPQVTIPTLVAAGAIEQLFVRRVSTSYRSMNNHMRVEQPGIAALRCAGELS
jgi:hypothetical protein